MSYHSTNVALCEVLGLDPKSVQAVNVKIRADKYPTMFVRLLVREPFEVQHKRFEIVERTVE